MYWENYGCEAWRDLYTHLETYHCRVAVAGGRGETYMGTGTLMVVGLPWLERVERRVREQGDLWLQEVRWLQGLERPIHVLGDLFLQEYGY